MHDQLFLRNSASREIKCQAGVLLPLSWLVGRTILLQQVHQSSFPFKAHFIIRHSRIVLMGFVSWRGHYRIQNHHHSVLVDRWICCVKMPNGEGNGRGSFGSQCADKHRIVCGFAAAPVLFFKTPQLNERLKIVPVLPRPLNLRTLLI